MRLVREFLLFKKYKQLHPVLAVFVFYVFYALFTFFVFFSYLDTVLVSYIANLGGFGPVFLGLYALFCCIYVPIAFRELKAEEKKEEPQADQPEEQKE